MTTFRLHLFDQAGHVFAYDVKRYGWTSMPEMHAGVMGHEEGLVFWNACPGAGELYLHRIEIDFGGPIRGILPCWNWTQNGSLLTIGTGGEYIPVRGSLRIRWSYPSKAPASVQYGPRRVNWSPLQRRDLITPLSLALVHPRETGMVPVFGERYVAPPGGSNRNSVSGWEQDARGMALRSDLVMNRMPIGCLDQETGAPIKVWSPDYTLAVGMNKSGQLAEFSRAFAVYDDARRPITTLPGECLYAPLLRGDNRDDSFVQFDGQHRGNAPGHVRAAAQCGDSIAIRDIEVLANDARMAKSDSSSIPFGCRDRAWRVDAFAHSRPNWQGGLYSALDTVANQGASGCFLRAPNGYPFSPNPWTEYGTPLDIDVDPTMERWLTCYALGMYGHVDAIRKAIHGSPWPAPKFLGVGRNQSEVFPTWQGQWGPPDYYGHLGIGVLAALDKTATDWREFALKQPTPDGKSFANIAALRNGLRVAERGQEQTAVLLAVLEEVLG